MISVVIISKDEPALDETLTDVTGQLAGLAEPGEIVVIDASSGRLDHIRRAHEPAVRWQDFERPAGVRVSIPHQRNAGVRAARGDIIVFTDAGCRPFPGWLDRLVAPLRAGESVTAGVSQDLDGSIQYELPPEHAGEATYLRESPTLNFAFRRDAFDAVGGFDESFQYGSDVDFSWRLADLGYRIQCVPGAILAHDYGTPGRQRRRAYVYGKARARLYRKHRSRRRDVLRNDPLVVVYPLFLIGLPVTLVFLFLGLPLMLIFPLYLLLLIIPAWRNRSHGIIRVLIDHLWFGAGVLAELTGR
jgi:cellulose synthase/poly-beta-1,6-N-acetylglucosamine synthase-like glycosyltransferase